MLKANQFQTPASPYEYIPAIDGLRALAVSIVVLFHAGFSWLNGGFIGVDVFFVISGFLITSNILRDIERGSWSFSEFYLKRIARLFPALFSVILLTLLASFFILSPGDLVRVGRAGIYTSLSVSNIFFWSESGYFGLASGLKPLLHTWSLSVEEQFYLIWPATIYLLFKIRARRAVVFGLTVLAVFSLLGAYYIVSVNQEAAFFLTPFRVYQFCLGGGVAVIGLSENGRLKAIATMLAIAMILILSMNISGNSSLFFSATLPAISTAIIIFGAKTPVVEKLLTLKPLVWIGQRSYSIYLVHWPLMVLWKMSTDYKFSLAEMLWSCIVSVALGSILYRLIETPFRFKKNFTIEIKSRVIAGITGLVVTILIVGTHYWGNDGYPSRVPTELKKTTSNIKGGWDTRKKDLRTGVCNIILRDSQVSDFDPSICASPPADKKSYLVLGDSYAGGVYLVMKKAFPDTYFGQLTIPGCRLRVPTDFSVQLNENQQKCKNLYQLVIEDIMDQEGFDGVVMASNWDVARLSEIDNLLEYFNDKQLKVVLFSQRIKFSERVPQVFSTSMSVEDATNKLKMMVSDIRLKHNAWIVSKFGALDGFVNLVGLQCQHTCDIIDGDGKIIYLDDSHLSLEGVDFFAAKLKKSYPFLLN